LCIVAELMAKDYFNENNINVIDYKDVAHLKQFTNPHGRIFGRRRTNLIAKNQRQVESAIKRARFMGFMPFIAR
jgi:small subunit ribosomal protein S18